MYKSTLAKSLLFITAFNLFVSAAMAASELQWPTTTSPASVQISDYTTNGNDSIYAPFGIRTSEGKYIVAGMTLENPNGDIYLDKLLSDGTVGDISSGWTSRLNIPNSGYMLDMVPDTSGGAFVAYNDTEIVKVLANGTLGSTASFSSANTNGCTSPLLMKLTADGTGGLYVAYTCDANVPLITHLTSNLLPDPSWTGTVGTVKGKALARTSGDSYTSVLRDIQQQSNGDLIISYYSYPSNNISTTKITANGTYTGFAASSPNFVNIAEGIAISDMSQESDGIGGAYLIYWEKDDTNQLGAIRFQHIEDNGTVLASPVDIVPFNAALYSTVAFQTVSDGTAVYVYWADDNASYIQKVNSDGSTSWTSGGILLNTGYSLPFNERYYVKTQSILADGIGGAIVALNNGSNQIFTQRINLDGMKDWGFSGLIFGTDTPGKDHDPSLISTGDTGEAILLWNGESVPGSSEEIYGQYIKTVAGGLPGGGGGGTVGTETVECNTSGNISISNVTPNVGFQPRTVEFYNDSTDAPLQGDNLIVDITDTRGYDPSRTSCGAPSVLSIQSSGLVNGATTLDLDLGSALTSASLSCTGNCQPTDLSFAAAVTGNTGAISSGLDMVNFAEAFDGTIRTTLSGDNLEVTRPNGPIPTGEYLGTITFTLS